MTNFCKNIFKKYYIVFEFAGYTLSFAIFAGLYFFINIAIPM